MLLMLEKEGLGEKGENRRKPYLVALMLFEQNVNKSDSRFWKAREKLPDRT